jgi:RHS repeat-associated protein
VYDQWDRPVLTQDAKLRSSNKWLFTKYDDMNRPVMTGFYTNAASSQSSMQTALNTQNMGRFETIATPTALPVYSVNQSFPVVTMNDIHSITFYDNYSWTNAVPAYFRQFEAGYSSYMMPASITYPYPQSHIADLNTRGQITGTITRVVPSMSLLGKVNFYDDKGRLIQTITDNIAGGTECLNMQYDFAGKVLRTFLKTNKLDANAQTFYILNKNNYDDLGRLKDVSKSVYGTIEGWNINKTEHIITTNEYDGLGQLKKKRLAPGFNNGAGLENLSHEYNIRGWLTGINKGYLTNSQQAWFGMELGYDKAQTAISGSSFGVPQYNGNISGTLWKTAGDKEIRSYYFVYDAVNRITSADFNQFTNGSFNRQAGIDFSVNNISYDANGNIKTMQQAAWKPGTSGLIDNLLYKYDLANESSNKLKYVRDQSNDYNSKLGDFKEPVQNNTDNVNNLPDYSYDANGNLVMDKNKNITSITYNYLNLPELIQIDGKGSIQYWYDAAGNKVKKQVTDQTVVPAKITNTQYIAGLVYENDQLQFIGHEEGRIRFTRDAVGLQPNGFVFDYFVKDHLGNTRVVLTEELQSDPYQTLSFDGNTTEINNQNAHWDNKDGQSINVTTARIARPGNFGTTTTNGNYAMLVRKSTGAIGAGKLLKVMAGDRMHTYVEYYYTAVNTDNSSASGITSIITNLVSELATSTSIAGALKGSPNLITNPLSTNADLIAKLNTAANTSGVNQAPKAYLNVIFFNDQFKYDKDASVVIPVNYSPNSKASIDKRFSNAIPAGKSGYVYVYFSNESNEMVYFDNFMLTHEKGPLLEETHYYPFGLIMAGISSKALKPNYAENKYKFNKGSELHNQEFGDGSGLEWYSTQFRSLDPQIGRWWQIDPKPRFEESSYASMANNPIRFNDPLGDVVKKDGFTEGEVLRMLNNGVKGLFSFKDGNLQYDKAKYNALKGDSRKIARAVVREIDSKKTFVIAKANNSTVIEKGEVVKYTKNGISYQVHQPDQYMGDHGAVTTRSKDGNTVTHWINTEYFEKGSKNEAPLNTSGQSIKQNPMWLVAYHEIGHGYLRDILNSPSQRGHTVDYENIIRSTKSFEKRGYDEAHPKPSTPYPKDDDN